jgi:hypothetical protein
MSSGQFDLARLDARGKRELLARLLRQSASALDEPFQLSAGQEALWFLHQIAPDSSAYSVAFCVRLLSEVDVDRLENSFRTLLERHPMLRCTFVADTPGPRQRIGQLPERCLERVDASGWSEDELTERVEQFYRRPFDLGRGPVFCATLFTCPDNPDILLISAHHTVFDAWSLGVILAELGLFYENGPGATMLTAPEPYATFVKWQRNMMESEQGRESWNYWQSRLASVLTPVDMPADHPRPNVRSFRGATHHFEVPAGLARSLRKMARAENATPFSLLAATFHVLLHRYTGAREVPIGTPLAGRTQGNFEQTVGYFVNPVVLCAPIDPGATFREHLAAMREVTISALQHGDFPFVEIVKRLRPDRDTSRTPLFQVMLNLIKTTQVGVAGDMLRAEGSLLRLGSLTVEAFPLEQQEGQFDLDLTLLDTGGAMPASLKYSTDLFEAETIARMAQYFLTLLSAAIADPDCLVSDLPSAFAHPQTPNALYQPPRTEAESALAAIWQEVLRVEKVGIDDNFFELGGHVQMAPGVLSRVRDRFGINLPLRTIIEAPTVRLLAGRLETLLWATTVPSTPLALSSDREEIEI